MSWGTILSGGMSLLNAYSSKKAGDKAAGQAEKLTDAQVAQLDFLTESGKEQYGIEKGIRSNLLKKIYEYQAVLDNVQKNLGDQPTFDKATLAAEQGVRYNQKIDDVNRALNRAGSVSQADLINRGLDSSTMAVEAQKALAGKGAELYDKAYTSSYDEALAYLQNRINAENASRMANIDEKRSIYDASTNALGSTIGAINPSAYTGTAQQYGTAAANAASAAANNASAFGSALDDLIYGQPKTPEGNVGGLYNYFNKKD